MKRRNWIIHSVITLVSIVVLLTATIIVGVAWFSGAKWAPGAVSIVLFGFVVALGIEFIMMIIRRVSD